MDRPSPSSNLKIRGSFVCFLAVVFSFVFTRLSCRDADDAVHARDGYDYDGYRLRVEFPRGGGPGGFRGGRGGGDRGRSSRGPPARRSQFRVLVTGLFGWCFVFVLESIVLC